MFLAGTVRYGSSTIRERGKLEFSNFKGRYTGKMVEDWGRKELGKKRWKNVVRLDDGSL